ncbi:diguanylate cyclase [Levilactobacillus zymae]|uniref:Diguanylate cyclase n=1 Tax=Levilactobacillus zymae TaxID=267363 RepID=A0ABQ0X0A8_9LACO|nr:EAL domain-containing protein [Levilactobacillus zymae]KRL07053.1 diguanylate cyclase phosphodiesterase domain 2 containing protein [Levilactobacillus zymae DSM 19395]QFR60398.1 EAL domain-containing protein [Levilactobacillus zymae]GEO73253.1 diguanylate cyclase [Levilactobacillus zymae]
MSLDQLIHWLFWISIVSALLFTGLVTFYFWYSRRQSNNYLENQDFDLRYFIQKQVDYRGRVTGYECLLRQRQADGSWRLPKELGSLPLQRVIFLLEDTFKSLPNEPITLSINLEYEQIVSPEFRYFVRWALSKIEPMNLAVEYTARKPTQAYQKPLFLRRVHEARQYGMHFDIDNVGADLDNLRNIEWLLDEVDTLKCSMRVFRKTDPNVWLDLNLQFWNQLSQRRHINLVLMGIEDQADEHLAEQLNIRLRQGYRFGRPVDPQAAHTKEVTADGPTHATQN